MGPSINSYFSSKVSPESPWQDTSPPWGQQRDLQMGKRGRISILKFIWSFHRKALIVGWKKKIINWVYWEAKGRLLNSWFLSMDINEDTRSKSLWHLRQKKSRGVYFPLCHTLPTLKKRERWLFNLINNAKPEEGVSCAESRRREIAKSRICW